MKIPILQFPKNSLFCRLPFSGSLDGTSISTFEAHKNFPYADNKIFCVTSGKFIKISTVLPVHQNNQL